MFEFDHLPGRTVFTKGKAFLFFSGYSYLGMSHLPEFTDLVKEGIDKFGLLFPSSRISNTQLALYQIFEETLSHLLGTEDTVSFSSGTLAGKAVADLVNKQHKHIFAAPHTHPAICCGQQLCGEEWKTQLVRTINASTADDFALVMDSVNPLTATVANFSFLHEISPTKKLTCVIDDSHAMGVIGTFAEGTSPLLPQLPNVSFVISYSLSKGFNINGGAVSCSSNFSLLLRKSLMYGTSTPIMPALVYAFIHGQAIYHRQVQALRKNITDLIEVTKGMRTVRSYPYLPFFILDPSWEQAAFDPYNIIISSFAYPDPAGKKTNRVILSALHTRQDLFKLSCALNKLHQKSTTI